MLKIVKDGKQIAVLKDDASEPEVLKQPELPKKPVQVEEPNQDDSKKEKE